MAKVRINGAETEAPAGALLREMLAPHTALEAPCGGHGRCGKCRVTARGALSEFAPEELRLLSEEERARGVRLACVTRVLGDCEVAVEQAAAAHVLGAQQTRRPVPAPLFEHYGAAVDIGTTTLAACLYDSDGELLARAGAMNPQAEWGADVIARIGAAVAGSGPALARSVRRGVNALLEEMADSAGIAPDEVDGLVITGNTAMLYLLTGTDPECLSHAPFRAGRLFGETLTGGQLELCCPAARVYLPRCMAAFVGADITTALLASGITEQSGVRMLADIGTNGEIALSAAGRLLCCSTAAGPAFEGAGLSMGMPGRDGAVDHVQVADGALQAHVLGDAPPRGICGSGAVDALACLLELEAMDETGLLEEDPTPICGPVQITQKDVRAIQLAKSAVSAGINTLMQVFGAAPQQVEELAVAGGFGSYLSVPSACAIGLLPPQLRGRVRVIGNGALEGAARLLLDSRLIPAAEALAARSEVVDLAANPTFMAAYTDGMFFELSDQ